MVEVRFLQRAQGGVVATEVIDGEVWGEFYKDHEGSVRYRFEDDFDFSANPSVDDLRRAAEAWGRWEASAGPRLVAPDGSALSSPDSGALRRELTEAGVNLDTEDNYWSQLVSRIVDGG